MGIATDHGEFGWKEELEVDQQEFGVRRERLEIPPIDRKLLSRLMDEFEETMEKGPNPKKKHLLHRLVKKVLIYDRRTIEIWYGLPNSRRFEDCNIWLPKCNSMRTRPGWVEPDIYFRIVHVAGDGHHSAPVAAYREQMVEIALGGPKGAFENGNIGALGLREPLGRRMRAAPPSRGGGGLCPPPPGAFIGR
jgi:hypothetical protein